jgi:dipeptidyl-peptidase-4
VTHGLADFLAQEELDRYEGFWISPDGSKVAYEAVDERHIPEYRIMHQGNAAVGSGAQEDHRYPFAGAPNPKVKLYTVSTKEVDAVDGVPSPTEFDLTGPFGEDFYLARVKWMPDGMLVVQVMDRLQENYALLRLDPTTGQVTSLLSESSTAWINTHNMLKPLGSSGKFLWASERTGFRHLYIFDPAAAETLQPLTSGEWIVEEIAGVDEEAGIVYFTGTSEGKWLDCHLFKVSLNGGMPEKITTDSGLHNVVVDTARKCFVDIVHSANQPAVATLRSLEDGRAMHTIYENKDPLIGELALDPPEYFTLPSTDQKVTLQASVYKPDPQVYGPGPYPTVVSCYGGPHVQFVANSWQMIVDLRAQALRSRGFLVLKVDNRGSFRRGLAFEAAVKRNMGPLEVEDQVAGVKHCIAQGLCDPARVAVYGWSYGGYPVPCAWH